MISNQLAVSRVGKLAATTSVLLLSCLVACVGVPHKGIRIDNPYAGVSWGTESRQKAALHVHTKVSDGRMYPHDVIDAYRELGYSVLAITDHNKVTYPWTQLKEQYGDAYENRDPLVLKMLDVQGNELSSHHHMNSFWSDHQGTKTETASLDAIKKKSGQAILNHPGRYKKDITWYTNLFTEYDQLLGVEVFNQGDRYPGDRKTWDAILTAMMPDRPVWGFSNDDMHKPDHLGRNWNVLLANDNSEESVRSALKRGAFYFVYSPKGHDGLPPEILSIEVSQRDGLIRVHAANTKRIEWISEGRVVGQGELLQLADVDELGSYVRAMLYSSVDKSVAGTQPFGIRGRSASAEGSAEAETREPFTRDME